MAEARGQQPALAVVDIDGVVADVRHRLGLIARPPKRWAEFFAAAADDPPLADGVRLVRELAGEYDVVWLTGRPEQTRRLTERWLAAQSLPTGPLLMRADDDYRPARSAKREELRRLRRGREIAVVVDDDPRVVEMLAEEGLPARLADWLPYAPTRDATGTTGAGRHPDHPAVLHSAQEQEGRT